MYEWSLELMNIKVQIHACYLICIYCILSRALNKREYLMIIFLIFSSKPYVVTPHLNCLVESQHMISMRNKKNNP